MIFFDCTGDAILDQPIEDKSILRKLQRYVVATRFKAL